MAKTSLDRTLPIVTTPHAAGELEHAGFGAIVALQPWTTHEIVG